MVISSVIIKFNLTNEFNSDALMFKPICFTMQSDVYLSNNQKKCQNIAGYFSGAALEGVGWAVFVFLKGGCGNFSFAKLQIKFNLANEYDSDAFKILMWPLFSVLSQSI